MAGTGEVGTGEAGTGEVGPEERGATVPPLARRLALVAVGLVALGVLVEGAALDPATLVDFREPGFAAVRLVAAASLPYLAVAVSVGALALLARIRSVESRASGESARGLRLLAGIAALLAAGIGAALAPSSAEALLAGEVEIDETGVRIGGFLTPAMAPDAVPLEDAGELGRVLVPASAAPRDVTVRWVVLRGEAPIPEGTRVELRGGGSARDLSEDLARLGPGQGALFTRALRVGPRATVLSLGVDHDSPPPEVLLDPARTPNPAGLALVAGGGDQLFRTGPPAGATSALLSLAGAHAEGGHAVLVVSGDDWGVHDLSALLAAQANVEVLVAGASASEWKVRLVGNDEARTRPVALDRCLPGDQEADGLLRCTVELREVGWNDLPPNAVVGVALEYAGDYGPFRLDLGGIRVAVPHAWRSQISLATFGSLDPAARPSAAMLVAGEPGAPDAGHRSQLVRLAAALLAVGAGCGLARPLAVARAWPLAAPLALASGPLLAGAIGPVLRIAAEPRLEQEPLVLGLIALSFAALAAIGFTPVRRHEAEPQAEGILAIGGLGVVAAIVLHAATDDGGGTWAAEPPSARLLPAGLRALAAAFDVPLLVLVTVAAARSRTLAGSVRAWLLPFATWSVIFLAIRFAKAHAFDYAAAYRRELAEGASWLGYGLLGTAQYHLPLFALLAVAAWAGARAPWLGSRAWALVLPLVAAVASPHIEMALATAVPDWELRRYLWRALALASVALAPSFVAAVDGVLARPGARRPFLALIALTWLPCSILVFREEWLGDGRFAMVAGMARGLLPALSFMGLSAAWRAAGGTPAPRALVGLGGVGLGVYAVHPAWIDALQILEHGADLRPAATALLNGAGVLAASLGTVWLLGRVERLQAGLGLGPVSGP